MNIAPILAKALQDLDKSMQGMLNDTKIACISETISNYAIAAAAACAIEGLAPGIAGVAAALTQAGFIWATYIKINKTLGISMSEHTVKFIGSAIVTNLITSAGSIIVILIGSSLLSIIPLAGQATAVALNAVLGYTLVYTSAIIYLRLITRMMQPDGTINVSESDDTKHIIHNILKEAKLKDIVNEGKASFKQAKDSGKINMSQDQLRCHKCGTKVAQGQRFCSECGHNLNELD